MTTCPNCGDPTASVSGLGSAVWCSTCHYYADQSAPTGQPGTTSDDLPYVTDYHPWQCGVGCEVCADRGEQF